MSRFKTDIAFSRWRLALVLAVIAGFLVLVFWKAAELQVVDNEFLQNQGDARTLRSEEIPANRGNILDRHGRPLAISTPVKSLWLNPKEITGGERQWERIETALAGIDVDVTALREKVRRNADKEFVYVKRRLPPARADKVLAQGLAGFYSQEEYKRYYPLGEAAAHVVGLTNTDDVGQEGMELAYEEWLKGVPGSRQVLKDRMGRVIRELDIKKIAEPGDDLLLSIDSRIQYLAYRSLKEAVAMRRAKAGTAIVVDVDSGEVLAIVNQPSYNPNNRSSISEEALRNRAIVDLMEPGSTVKPFTVISALKSGTFDTESIIDTSPGYIRVDKATIRDPVNYGKADLEKIITKSSQVGAVKLGLAMGQEPMLNTLSQFGFGTPVGTNFPGEAFSPLPGRSRWSKAEIATLAYGYGFQVTPLQLAQAYLTFAREGVQRPLSLLASTGATMNERRVITEDLNDKIVQMLGTVVDEEKGGTGTRANLATYRVAGKTGTAWHYNVAKGGYDSSSYISLFAGFAPVSDPEIVTIVTINEPAGEEYGGGQVAAPVFADITEGALRMLNVPPDKMPIKPEISMTGASLQKEGG